MNIKISLFILNTIMARFVRSGKYIINVNHVLYFEKSWGGWCVVLPRPNSYIAAELDDNNINNIPTLNKYMEEIQDNQLVNNNVNSVICNEKKKMKINNKKATNNIPSLNKYMEEIRDNQLVNNNVNSVIYNEKEKIKVNDEKTTVVQPKIKYMPKN